MQEHSHLLVQQRTITGRAVKALRKDGLIPANVYGAGVESIAVQVPYHNLRSFLRDTGESEIVDLRIEGEEKTRPVLLGAVQVDPVTYSVMHVDFRQVDLTKEVTAEVELVFEGEPALVKSGEAVLLTLLDSIEVTALPDNLPSEFVVDVSHLENIGDQITIGDLTISEHVTIENDSEELVCKLDEVRQQEEEEPVAEEDAESEGEDGAAEQPGEDAQEDTIEE